MLRVRWAAVAVVLSIPASAVQPGDIVTGTNGLAAAAAPTAVNRAVLHGSPALVIAVRGEWTRLLAADGSSGWTSRQLGGGVHARIAGDKLELSDRSPDMSSVAEGVETFTVPAKEASIVGASMKSRAESPQQLMLPPRLNPFVTPWIEIRAGSRTGWVVPSDLRLEWGEPVPPGELIPAMDRLGFSGIVRAPFLRPVEQAIIASHTPGASILHFDSISSKPNRIAADNTSVKTLRAVVRHGPEWLAEFSSPQGSVFYFPGRGDATVAEGAPVMINTASADLNADGKPELVLQLAGTYGDGYATVLWIVNGDGTQGLRIDTVPLGGSNGEPGGSTVEAAWWIDENTLWIARAERRSIEYAAIPASNGPAHGVIVARFRARDAAEERAISRSLQAFPMRAANGSVEWGVGRLFRTKAAAEAWRGTASPRSMVIALPLHSK